MDAANLKVQSRVQLTVGESIYEGTILPKEGDYIVLKQNSGYNIGIHPKHITKIEELPQENSPRKEQLSITQDQTLPKITLLHTGGTIASKVDYKTGGVIADFDPASLLALFPELTEAAYIQSEFLGNMFSDDFRFAHFNIIAKKIEEAHKQGQTKFIVTSGTDFLHYLSAGLSFMLKDLNVGVLVVGSQRSSDRGSSDAGMNLVCASQFLAHTDFHGVGICMHHDSSDQECVILPGVNSRKMHSSRRDAFKAINSTPYAYVNYAQKAIKLNRDLPSLKDDSKSKITLLKEELKIGLFYSKPNTYAKELEVYKNFDGLVIAGSGLGHLPITNNSEETKEHDAIKETITTIAKKVPVLMSTQTLYGRVHMDVYAPARYLQEIGVIGHLSSMTPETSYIKLAYVLSKNLSREELASELMNNYCGELNDSRYEDFDLTE